MWWAYEYATAGRRAIVASRGLFERYGIGVVDEDDAAEGDEAENVIGEVTVEVGDWIVLVSVDATDRYIELVELWAVAGAHGPPPSARQLVLEVLDERQARRRVAA